MAFVVDGSDWKLNGKSATQVAAAIEQFLGALGDANDAEIPV